MRLVTNLSPNFPLPEVTSLVKYAAKYTKHADDSQIRVYMSDVRTHTFGGLAWINDRLEPNVMVSIHPIDAVYPKTEQMNLATPRVELRSWQEEFILVMAHELRHIDQFMTGTLMGPLDEWDAEVDAERFGCAVLEAYRADQAELDKSAKAA